MRIAPNVMPTVRLDLPTTARVQAEDHPSTSGAVAIATVQAETALQRLDGPDERGLRPVAVERSARSSVSEWVAGWFDAFRDGLARWLQSPADASLTDDISVTATREALPTDHAWYGLDGFVVAGWHFHQAQ